MTLELVGIDIAKAVFHVHGVDRQGRKLFKKKVYRSDMAEFFCHLPKCRIVMEACGSSNHWCRVAERYGHSPQLIAPQYVKPFVKRNKNDFRDAEAICEAAQRPSMKYVPRRSIEQQDLQNLHRVRERLVKSRTALVNEIRGLLQEYGIAIPKGRRTFAKVFVELLFEKQIELTSLAQETFQELWEEYGTVAERIAILEKKIMAIHKAHPVCQRLGTIPGVGYLTATSMVAAIGDISVFKNGRQLAAWLGLTPREHSTGGKQRLFGISKRGDVYLRKLLIHGARVTLRYLQKKEDRQSVWLKDLMQRKGTNRTAVALANKNARTIWALITREEEFQTFSIAA